MINIHSFNASILVSHQLCLLLRLIMPWFLAPRFIVLRLALRSPHLSDAQFPFELGVYKSL